MKRRPLLAAAGIVLSTPLAGCIARSAEGGDDSEPDPFSPHQRGSVMVVNDAGESHRVEVTISPLDSEGEEKAPKFEADATLAPDDGISANSIEFRPGEYRITAETAKKDEVYDWTIEESDRRGVGKAWVQIADDDLTINIITTLS